MGASNEAKIGGREFASIFMIVVGMKLSDITVTILYESGETAGWMIPLISLAFILIPYTLLMSVMKRWSGKGLPEVLFQVGGKFGGTLICLAFFAGALLMTAVTSRGYVDIINVMVYQQSPLYVLYFMLMGAASYVAHRGFEAIARISWVLIFLVEAALVLLVAIMWRDVDWLRLNPWAGPGIKEIVKTGFVHSAMFAEIMLASVFIPRLDSLRTFRLALRVGFTVSGLKIAFFMAVYTAVFDYPEVVHIAYPFQQLTKNATFGTVFTHAESFFIGFWLVISVMYFGAYVYLLAYLFGQALRTDRYRKLCLPMGGLAFLIGLIPANTEQVRSYWEMLIYNSTILYFVLPAVIWLLDWIWRRRHAKA